MSSLRKNYGNISNVRKTPFSRQTTLDGTPNTDDELSLDGSVNPIESWIQPLSTDVIEINTINIVLADSGNPDSTDYGNINGPLLNGIDIFYEINGVRNFLFSKKFNENDDFVVSSSEFSTSEFANNVRILTYRLKLESTIKLNGNSNDKFGIIINDDLTGLIEHKCQVKGSTYTNDLS